MLPALFSVTIAYEILVRFLDPRKEREREKNKKKQKANPAKEREREENTSRKKIGNRLKRKRIYGNQWKAKSTAVSKHLKKHRYIAGLLSLHPAPYLCLVFPPRLKPAPLDEMHLARISGRYGRHDHQPVQAPRYCERCRGPLGAADALRSLLRAELEAARIQESNPL